MRLISKEDLGQVGKVGFAGNSFDSVVRLVSRFSRCFKYGNAVNILFFFYLFWFVCFYMLLDKGVFRTLSNIKDGAFCDNIQRNSAIFNYFRKSFILDAWQRSEYASVEYKVNCLLMLA